VVRKSKGDSLLETVVRTVFPVMVTAALGYAGCEQKQKELDACKAQKVQIYNNTIKDTKCGSTGMNVEVK
jgi:hypothetical protein